MFHPLPVFIGLRYAKSSKGNHFIAFINFFSVAGIALGLMALITVLSVMNGLEGELKSRILGIMPHMLVDTRGQGPEKVQRLANLAGVAHTTPFIESEGVVQAARGLQGVMIQGVDGDFMARHSVIAENMLMGSLADLKPGEYGLVVGRILSIKLGMQLGDRVRLMTAGSSVFTPLGRMPSQRMFKLVGIFDVGSELDDKVVLTHLHDAARLLRKKPKKLTQTRLFLHDAFDYQQVAQQVFLPQDNWRARQGPLFDAVKMEKNMMALMLLLIIAVAAFNIVSALVMIVTEKQGDIAILRTQGMNTGQILKVFLFNGLYNGLKGTLLGLLGGLLLVSQLNTLLEWLGAPVMVAASGQGLPIDVRGTQIGLLVLMSMGLCLLATLYPAYRATRVKPAHALQYE